MDRKLWLDDRRPAPDGWVRRRRARTAMEYLDRYWDEISEISLDHDLGEDEAASSFWPGFNVGPLTPPATGEHVLRWIEAQVFLNGRIPPFVIRLHTANPVGRARMEQACASIRSFIAARQASRPPSSDDSSASSTSTSST